MVQVNFLNYFMRNMIVFNNVHFTGLIVLLHSCNTVNIYEYVPSMRFTKRCHYFDVHDDIGCTLGDWHPLSTEKLITLSLNEGTDKDIFITGRISISGFSKQNC